MSKKKQNIPPPSPNPSPNPAELLGILSQLKGNSGNSGNLGGLGALLGNIGGLQNTAQDLHNKVSGDPNFTSLVTNLTQNPEIKKMADSIAATQSSDILGQLQSHNKAKEVQNTFKENIEAVDKNQLGDLLGGAAKLALSHADFLSAQADLIRHNINKDKMRRPINPQNNEFPSSPPPLNLDRAGLGNNGTEETEKE